METTGRAGKSGRRMSVETEAFLRVQDGSVLEEAPPGQHCWPSPGDSRSWGLLAPSFAIHSGPDEGAPRRAGVSGGSPLRLPGLCRGRNPPLAFSASRLPACRPRAELGWACRGGTHHSWDLAPRPRQAWVPSAQLCPLWRPRLLMSQLPRSGSQQLPRPGQVCTARGGQTAGQAERHL